jgi:manganese/zinc/iron transport system permease protein
MVLSATAVFAISLLFAPRRGMLARFLLRRRNRIKTANENILTTLFRLDESSETPNAYHALDALAERRSMTSRQALPVLQRLQNQGLVLADSSSLGAGWRLTPPGFERARRVVRMHRLWEIYLTERLHLASDHVHSDAEDVEHLITPEIEAELERILHRPAVDPHGRPIPYADPDEGEPDEPAYRTPGGRS